MAFKGLIGGASGSFYNLADDFGYFDDTAYVALEGLPQLYQISTYGGNDLIDLRHANSDNAHDVLAGAGRDTVLGGDAEDRVYDQSGNDRYVLAGGNDVVYAGFGNDTMSGGAGLDILRFNYLINDMGALDGNVAGITCDLAKTGVQDFGIFGQDRISGFERAFGGNGNDRLLGNAADNLLSGYLSGDDTLNGRGGKDQLAGDSGRDLLIGGAGADYLEPGLGDGARDVIRFLRIGDGVVGTDPLALDYIDGFTAGTAATADRIDLSPIDARSGTPANDAFKFKGLGSFSSAAGEVRLEIVGGNTLVHVDIDGDAVSEMNFWVNGVTALGAADFIL
jgi:Ca2+-binding RTX toxin-like protein